jgi:hypothetical protein
MIHIRYSILISSSPLAMDVPDITSVTAHEKSSYVGMCSEFYSVLVLIVSSIIACRPVTGSLKKKPQ